jgi:hypothetical protein
MLPSNDLVAQIKEAFQDAIFPSHLGLHAGLAKDKWIKDPETLKQITKEKDYWGDWWDVPYEHLEKCGALALNYLDPVGIYFYFPAFMLMAIQEKTPKSLIPVLIAMDPNPFKDEESYQYFCGKFKLFGNKKKQLCRDFLCFMKTIHAGQTGLIKSIDRILESNFWMFPTTNP